MDEIKSIIVKTIISVHVSNASGVRLFVQNRTSVYELFGFDILLDSKLKPWLMEVNISPSLKASCDLDYRIKEDLVVDLLNMVGVRVSDLEMAKGAAGCRSKNPKWRKPVLTTSERNKQKRWNFAEKNGGGGGSVVEFLSNLTEDDLRMLKETEDEVRRIIAAETSSVSSLAQLKLLM
ncbi:Tubulin polyglutamylase ttll4 [Borealophlyctis nickersoniae]|nr:Tubulin polyglutamylase ttll4 [Borealophlyctis nickersoniae]